MESERVFFVAHLQKMNFRFLHPVPCCNDTRRKHVSMLRRCLMFQPKRASTRWCERKGARKGAWRIMRIPLKKTSNHREREKELPLRSLKFKDPSKRIHFTSFLFFLFRSILVKTIRILVKIPVYTSRYFFFRRCSSCFLSCITAKCGV